MYMPILVWIISGIMKRKERERRIVSVKDCVEATNQGFDEYAEKSKGKLIEAASNSNVNKRTNRKTAQSRKQKWEEKQLYG